MTLNSKDGLSVTDFMSGIWAAIATPFDINHKLDLKGIESNAAKFTRLGLEGVFCNGLVGELWTLSISERRQILEAVIKGGGSQLKVGVVVNAPSLGETIQLAEHARDNGAHHIVLMRPAGFNQQEEIEKYIAEVSISARMPLVIFDGGGHMQIEPETILRLAQSGHISGIKCTRGNDAADMLRQICPSDIAISDPYESHWLTNLLRYSKAPLYADPEPYLFQLEENRPIQRYYQAVLANDYGTAAQVFKSLEPLRLVYQKWIMLPLQKGYSVSAYVKRWMQHMGYAAGPVRMPQQNLCMQEAAKFDTELLTAFRQVYGEHFDFCA